MSQKAELNKLTIECDDKTMKGLEKVIDDIKAITSVKEISFGKQGTKVTELIKIDISQ